MKNINPKTKRILLTALKVIKSIIKTLSSCLTVFCFFIAGFSLLLLHENESIVLLGETLPEFVAVSIAFGTMLTVISYILCPPSNQYVLHAKSN